MTLIENTKRWVKRTQDHDSTPRQRLAPDSPRRKQKQPENRKQPDQGGRRGSRTEGSRQNKTGALESPQQNASPAPKEQQQKKHTGAQENRVQNRKVQGAGQGADRTGVQTVPGADRAEGHGGDVDPGQGAGPGADNPGARTVQGAGREDGSGDDPGGGGPGAAHDGDVAWPVAWKVASQLRTPTG
ncbi:uncharacterized protein LOC112843239 [Oreochromis niloticus]|uniref:uncharacterized protein LOC112843239 n=1 Tax=Oreochromis niloticus TaxID=8128 RepID=UPI000DF1D140|nr:uncharacterized protein LOC112843239 [Oreochromis niloticus]XP_025757215.1 uncharacterized protein LOC112843239 [Oreochromis niloticus]